MLAIGIDPSSGSSSPVGLAIYDIESREILLVEEIKTQKGDPVHLRLIDIHEQLATILMALDPEERAYAFIENFVMQGKNGQLLAQATGAIMCAVPSFCEYAPVHNITMKKFVGGSGKSDKAEVARGVLSYFSSNADSEQKVRELINAGKWDVLDALGLAIAGVGSLRG